jgi:quaternary ammonium compound-resistance protein SugE
MPDDSINTSASLAWLYLLLAGICEIGLAISLKYTENFTRFWPTLIMIACMAVSFFFLSLSLNQIPIGTSYAIWTGIGAAGTALIGICWFEESADWPRLVCLGLIVLGMVGLKLTSA